MCVWMVFVGVCVCVFVCVCVWEYVYAYVCGCRNYNKTYSMQPAPTFRSHNFFAPQNVSKHYFVRIAIVAESGKKPESPTWGRAEKNAKEWKKPAIRLKENESR